MQNEKPPRNEPFFLLRLAVHKVELEHVAHPTCCVAADSVAYLRAGKQNAAYFSAFGFWFSVDVVG